MLCLTQEGYVEIKLYITLLGQFIYYFDIIWLHSITAFFISKVREQW